MGGGRKRQRQTSTEQERERESEGTHLLAPVDKSRRGGSIGVGGGLCPEGLLVGGGEVSKQGPDDARSSGRQLLARIELELQSIVRRVHGIDGGLHRAHQAHEGCGDVRHHHHHLHQKEDAENEEDGRGHGRDPPATALLPVPVGLGRRGRGPALATSGFLDEDDVLRDVVRDDGYCSPSELPAAEGMLFILCRGFVCS